MKNGIWNRRQTFERAIITLSAILLGLAAHGTWGHGIPLRNATILAAGMAGVAVYRAWSEEPAQALIFMPFLLAAAVALPLPWALLFAAAVQAPELIARRQWRRRQRLFTVASSTLASGAAAAIAQATLSLPFGASTERLALAFPLGAGAFLLVPLICRDRALEGRSFFALSRPEAMEHLWGSLIAAGLTMAWVVNPWFLPVAAGPLLSLSGMLRRRLAPLDLPSLSAPVDGLNTREEFVRLAAAMQARTAARQCGCSYIMADIDQCAELASKLDETAMETLTGHIEGLICGIIRRMDCACRWEDDAFAICLPDTGPEDARAIAERIRTAVAVAPFQVGPSAPPTYVTISMGLACSPQHGSSLEELLDQTELALAWTKRNGRNTIHIANIASSRLLEARLERKHANAAPALPARPRAARDGEAPAPAPVAAAAPSNAMPRSVMTLITVVAAAAALFSIVSILQVRAVTIGPLLLLVALCVASELLSVDIMGNGAFSTSSAIILAIGLLYGVGGVVVVTPLMAIAQGIAHRKPPMKIIFNWANFTLASGAAASLFQLVGIGGHLDDIVLVGAVAVAGGVLLSVVSIAMLMAVISLSSGLSPLAVLRDQLSWQWTYRIVLGLLAGAAAIADKQLGSLGALIVLAPLFLVRYSARQVTDIMMKDLAKVEAIARRLRTSNTFLADAHRSMANANEDLLTTLASAVDQRDPYVYGHSHHVARYAVATALEMGIGPERVDLIRQAALLHDIGKIAIPESILYKPDKLTGEEYEIMKTHAVIGAAMVERSERLRHLAIFIRHHHEAYNGAGYPTRLAGEAIPLESRIIAVCDTVESMAADRPYRQASTPEQIMRELARCAGSQFDPTVVRALLAIAAREGEQFIVNSAREVAEASTQEPGREALHQVYHQSVA